MSIVNKTTRRFGWYGHSTRYQIIHLYLHPFNLPKTNILNIHTQNQLLKNITPNRVNYDKSTINKNKNYKHGKNEFEKK